MSGGSEKDRVRREAGKEYHWRRYGAWTGAVLLICAGIVVLASYALRTPLALENLVAPQLEAQAQAQGIDLEVGAMSGVGFSGIRLYEVAAGIDVGEGRAVVRADRVDLFPDVGASIRNRRPILTSADGHEVQIVFWRAGADRSPTEAGESDDQKKRDLERWLSEDLELTVEKLSFRIGDSERSARLYDLVATVDVGALRVIDLDGRGEIGGVELGLAVRDGAIFAAPSSSQLDEAFAELPVQVDLEGVSVEPEAIGAYVETRQLEALGMQLHGLTARPRHEAGPVVHAETSSLQGEGASFRWEAPLATLEGGERDYELSTVELSYRRDAPGFSFLAVVGDGEGGRIDVEGNWHLPTSIVAINAWIDDFRWDGTMPWPWGDGSPVEQGRVDGTFHGDVDLIHRMIALDGEARLRDFTMDLPFLSDEAMTFEELHVELPLTFDARGQALSVVDGKLRVGEVAPLGFDARIVEAGGGTHVFDLTMSGEEIDAEELAKNLPPELTGVIADTKLSGDFGVSVELAGHSAFPESLVMEVNFWGGVAVLEDGRWTDREALRAGDVVVFDSEEHPGKLIVRGEWQELMALPHHVPAAVLAAEDTAFFEHDGLDWTGLRMAMVQNIKEGALVRGGSTITQQVAKNLFLTHDRTVSRKLQEAFLTWRVEERLTKEQILELYLNVVEWGPDIHGLFSASHYYFEKSPEELEPLEMVMLSSILPSPIRFGGAIKADHLPSSREDKMRRVLENMRFLEQLSWADYGEAVAALDEGRVGRLELIACADDDTAPPEAPACDEIELEVRDGEEMTFEEWEVRESAIEAGWMPLTH